MLSKPEIRALMRSKSETEIDETSIFRQIESLQSFKDATTVLAFMSLPDEIDTHRIVEEWSRTRRVALPVVEGDKLRLKLYDRDRLVPGYMGILEPSADAEDVQASEIDLAIVPGVAFDREGHRLGRGKGFYDRLLPDLTCLKVGVCQSFRILDEIPVDSWDQKLDLVISED